MNMKKEELINSSGGWNPGKLEYKPIFVFMLNIGIIL